MTHSLVAFDPDTGECGVAVQSHWFSVGTLVTWGEPGVGAVATQANVETAYGPRGLARMREGASAPEALVELLAADELAAVRQVAMVDAHGGVAAHTGADCMSFCGQELGHHHSAQANLMASDQVWSEMSATFLAADGPLAWRLLDALDAGEAAGGDIRGRQSAAIVVVPGEAQCEELGFWAALSLIQLGDVERGLPLMRRTIAAHRGWAQLLGMLEEAAEAPAASEARRLLGE
jgi:uncharacterized Ntn-hydrolase superfamily protein